jgi:hypothetical protein
MVTIREALLKRIEEGTGESDAEIVLHVSKKLGVKSKSVWNKFSTIRKKEKKNSGGRSLQNFKQTYDKNTIIPQKIRNALKELGPAWEYEAEFIKRAGVNYTDINIFRDMFSDYLVIIKRENKRIWCGTIPFANQLKELI